MMQQAESIPVHDDGVDLQAGEQSSQARKYPGRTRRENYSLDYERLSAVPWGSGLENARGFIELRQVNRNRR